ncbi:MAG TPA: hypothetical protein VHC86_09225 [Opitutaceae bacterium]|nr:hypothetical protein [Opitutaceae bacterium]
MNSQHLLVAAALALGAVPALRTSAQTPASEKKGLFYKFSLAPKSAQANPRLDFTVVTDLTKEGKALPEASADHPSYYVLYSEGYQTRGDSQLDLKTLSAEDMSKVLQRSLGERGYHPATLPSHPPTLLVMYSWGSYAQSSSEHVDWTFIGGSTATGGGYDPSDASSLPGQPPASPQALKDMMDRAQLIGGDRFVAQVRQMLLMEKDAENAQMNGSTLPPVPTDQLLDPSIPFKAKSPRNDFMMELVKDDLYYVVASAYDYRAFAREHKSVLLWRTRMAISASGVTQHQALPTLVMSASPYFGRDTDGAVILNRQMTERIEIGKPTVVGYGDAPAQK